MSIALRTPVVLVTDEDLVRVSRDNPGHRFEREEDGTVLVSPTFTNSGAKSDEAFAQLYDYVKRVGGKAFDSNTGFAIGPGKRAYVPDAAWVSQARIDKLSDVERARFWPISPDVAIEVVSESDNFRDIVEKIESGVRPAGLSLDFGAIIDA